MQIDTKEFFSQLDESTIKKASKKDKNRKKKNKKDPFGYDFNPNDFDKKKKHKKSKDKDSISKKVNKSNTNKKEKKSNKNLLGDSKITNKILKGIKNSDMREQFKHQRNLIDNKKFWTND